MSTAILELVRVDARYRGGPKVLDGISLAVEPGRITALLGANGAGKTTTLRAISRLMVSAGGTIRYEGRDLDGLSTEDRARAGIAHVPDGRGTIATLSVEENLRLGGLIRRDRRSEQDLEKVYGYFPRLKERRSQQAGTLSGGEQQMLAISRALMGRPKLLLLDEPSFGLAPLVVQDIFRILTAIQKDEGMAMLLVEQNARIALAVAERAYLLETGRVVLSGTPAELERNDRVRQAYLGE